MAPTDSSQLTNWAGNVEFGARRVHRPTTIAQLREIVEAAEHVRPLGTAHSFNRIADTAHDLVSVAGLPPECDIDSVHGIARVAGGLRYGEVAPQLHAAGWALPNLGSLPHISIAGACATGTHGSGNTNGCLATAASRLELVTAGGDLTTLDSVAGAAVGLGALGVVTHVTLNLVPTFDIAQDVYDGIALPEREDDCAELFGAGYSVSLFTRWTDPATNQAWVKRRPDIDPALPSHWLGGTRADQPRHPIAGHPADFCTEQLGRPGPWFARLPHFRLEFNPSAGDELQSEYLVPRDRAVDAIAAVASSGERIAPVLQVSELRTVAGDELWLSPAYRRDSLAIHFTWRNDIEAVAPVMADVEERLRPFAARPHWGKIFVLPLSALPARYERFSDFAELAARLDPTGKLRNPWLTELLSGGSGTAAAADTPA
jgi:xylitol oxidase